MAVSVVFGGQWGDEGKGKIVDYLARRAHYVVRCQGGNNAGHTVVNERGTFKLYLIPSGICYDNVTNVIGNGVALNPPGILQEIEGLKAQGVETKNLRISDRAAIVMPYHIDLDRLEEQARGDARIGTTLRGIGPAYGDKVARRTIRAGDLLNPETLETLLRMALPHVNTTLTRLYNAPPIEPESLLAQFIEHGAALRPYITDTVDLLHGALKRGDDIVLEGAQGTLLDLEFGTYPYVTSSYPTAAGACLGAGIPPTAVRDSFGVFKAYVSRVGSGPFPTEQENEIGEEMRRIGVEYGTATGRPRRCGWFDAVAGRYSARVNGCTGIVLSRLDILDSFPLLRVCTHYTFEGERIDRFPASLTDLHACEPVYEDFPGWESTTRECRRIEDLPANARRYVDRIAELLEAPVKMVGVGPARPETIVVN